MTLRGHARISPIEWRNLALIGFLMFVVTYGPLFWAMQYVTSSMTAVIEATLPVTTIALEVLVFRTQPFQWRIGFGVGVGFLGVMLLLFNNDGQRLALLPCLVILGAGTSWSLGTVLCKRLSLPASRPLSAGAQMMLGGLVLLGLSFAAGDMRSFPQMSLKAVLALVYLIVFGSFVAYAAYVWLLGRFSATRVSSHAYVNPLFALAVGHFAAGEVVMVRSIVASFIILGSVFLILSKSSRAAVNSDQIIPPVKIATCPPD